MQRATGAFAAAAASFLLLYAVLGFFAGAVQLDALGSVDLTPRVLRLAATGVSFLLFTSIFVAGPRERRGAILNACTGWLAAAAVLALTVLLLSRYPAQAFTYFEGAQVAADALAAGAVAAVLMWFARARPRAAAAEAALLGVQFLCAISLLAYLDGRLIFADDHPSFLYRFQLLRDNFPFVPFYNTDWNAGYSGREFFPSGMLNVYLFFWPLLYFAGDIGSASDINLYNYVLLLYVMLIPWACYWAARIFGCSRAAAACTGVLALGPSLSYFEWLLRYGTLGFVFSVGMAPLALALSYRLSLAEQSPRLLHMLALTVVSFCCITWSLSFLVFLPLTAAALVGWRRTFAADRRKLVLAFIVLFAVINGPWMRVFVRESKVFSFLSGETLPGSDTRSVFSDKTSDEESKAKPELIDLLRKKYRGFREELRKVNPLIVFMFIPGVLLLPAGSPRSILLITVLWLGLIAVVGDALKPQLELRRMIIPASFLMTIGAGAALCRTLLWARQKLGEKGSPYGLRAAAAAAGIVLSGLLLLSPLSAAAHYTNRTERFYRFAPKYFLELADAIRRRAGDGRTLFFGFILHDFGASNYAAQDGGHIAPLAKLSGKEMYASDFYHSRWSTVDPIPASYRKRGAEGIEEFLDLVNVSAVVTFKREWLKYCRERPGIYSEVYRGGRFTLFTRRPSPAMEGDAGYFLRGEGELRNLADGFAVKPRTGEVVLKYRFHPRLKAYPEGSAELFPVPAYIEDRGGGEQEQVSFVGVRPHNNDGSEIRIGFFDRRG